MSINGFCSMYLCITRSKTWCKHIINEGVLFDTGVHYYHVQ